MYKCRICKTVNFRLFILFFSLLQIIENIKNSTSDNQKDQLTKPLPAVRVKSWNQLLWLLWNVLSWWLRNAFWRISVSDRERDDTDLFVLYFCEPRGGVLFLCICCFLAQYYDASIDLEAYWCNYIIYFSCLVTTVKLCS